MTTKTTGAEWKRYYSDNSAWPEGACHDYEVICVDGNQIDPDADLLEIPDSASMTIAHGTVFPTREALDGPSLELHFKRWRKAQNTVFFACEAPRACADAVMAAILAAGGRVHAL